MLGGGRASRPVHSSCFQLSHPGDALPLGLLQGFSATKAFSHTVSLLQFVVSSQQGKFPRFSFLDQKTGRGNWLELDGFGVHLFLNNWLIQWKENFQDHKTCTFCSGGVEIPGLKLNPEIGGKGGCTNVPRKPRFLRKPRFPDLVPVENHWTLAAISDYKLSLWGISPFHLFVWDDVLRHTIFVLIKTTPFFPLD